MPFLVLLSDRSPHVAVPALPEVAPDRKVEPERHEANVDGATEVDAYPRWSAGLLQRRLPPGRWIAVKGCPRPRRLIDRRQGADLSPR